MKAAPITNRQQTTHRQVPKLVGSRELFVKNCAPGGSIVMFSLVFGSIGIVMIGALVSWALGSSKLARAKLNSEIAFQIAESGVDYYRWHLAHDTDDYQDGTGLPGPYVHEFRDKDGNLIGHYSLSITPPPVGSTIVTIVSTGYTVANPNHQRAVQVQMAIPSLARYAVAANANMRFGSGTIIYGPVHSNGGIRFDGLAYNVVTSAKSKYDDPDHSGAQEFGVHTHIYPTDPLPPNAVPSRPDIFVAGRQFPVPAIDFAGISGDLAEIKSDAQANGHYFASSGALGYRLVLKTNDTFDLYRVNSLKSAPWGCSSSQSGWGTWSINTYGSSQTLLGTYAFPTNGLIFVEDHAWVEGQIQTARLTIASARFPENPSTNTSITINNDLRYTTYDGQDVMALMAQNNFNVGLYSEDDLQIDAALVAKNGRVGRHYYSWRCGSNYVRSTITLNGMIATNQRYGFAYTDGTGYINRNINYDANLLYGPPPSFPLTSDQYALINWEELR